MLLLLTGASGAGKSTVRRAVEAELSPAVECVELFHIANRPPDGAWLAWRQQAAENAVRRAVELQEAGRHLLLAGDPIAAVEVAAAPSAPQLDAIAVCLLDVLPAVQAERLVARGDPPHLIPHHQAFGEWMRAQAADPLHMLHVVADDGWDEMRWDRLPDLAPDWHVETIASSGLTASESAAETIVWVRRALAGTAPLLRVIERLP